MAVTANIAQDLKLLSWAAAKTLKSEFNADTQDKVANDSHRVHKSFTNKVLVEDRISKAVVSDAFIEEQFHFPKKHLSNQLMVSQLYF